MTEPPTYMDIGAIRWISEGLKSPCGEDPEMFRK